jgi:hypothetical protein
VGSSDEALSFPLGHGEFNYSSSDSEFSSPVIANCNSYSGSDSEEDTIHPFDSSSLTMIMNSSGAYDPFSSSASLPAASTGASVIMGEAISALSPPLSLSSSYSSLPSSPMTPSPDVYHMYTASAEQQQQQLQQQRRNNFMFNNASASAVSSNVSTVSVPVNQPIIASSNTSASSPSNFLYNPQQIFPAVHMVVANDGTFTVQQQPQQQLFQSLAFPPQQVSNTTAITVPYMNTNSICLTPTNSSNTNSNSLAFSHSSVPYNSQQLSSSSSTTQLPPSSSPSTSSYPFRSTSSTPSSSTSPSSPSPSFNKLPSSSAQPAFLYMHYGGTSFPPATLSAQMQQSTSTTSTTNNNNDNNNNTTANSNAPSASFQRAQLHSSASSNSIVNGRNTFPSTMMLSGNPFTNANSTPMSSSAILPSNISTHNKANEHLGPLRHHHHHHHYPAHPSGLNSSHLPSPSSTSAVASVANTSALNAGGRVRQTRPKVVEAKGGKQCGGRNRKKGIQCRNAALMEYIGPRPIYCAEHIDLDPNSLYTKCKSPYQKEPGDNKGCKEVVLKEFGICYKHYPDFVNNELLRTRDIDRARIHLTRTTDLLLQLEREAAAAKKKDGDLYQRKNKLIPKFQEMKKLAAKAIDSIASLLSQHQQYQPPTTNFNVVSPSSGDINPSSSTIASYSTTSANSGDVGYYDNSEDDDYLSSASSSPVSMEGSDMSSHSFFLNSNM